MTDRMKADSSPSQRFNCRKLLAVILLLAFLPGSGLQAGSQTVNIKMASLAPEGSPWHQILQEIAQDWRDASNDQVRLQIYAGGVIGDESDMVRKMRLNQVQAAALTAEGLSYIDRGIYGLSLPLLVDDYAELDWLRAQVEPELRCRYEEKGVTVLAWVDVGWAYWFARNPVRTPDDLRKLRIFTWAGDPHSPGLWRTARIQAVSLSAVDVLPGLQTGLIDAIDTSPLIMVSNQWFAVARHMTNLPWAAMTGGIIINQTSWDRIPKDLQSKLLAVVEKRVQRVKDEIRYTDDEAVAVMREHGLEVVDISESERFQWQQFVDQYSPILRGTLVDTTMYDRIQALKRVMDSPDFTLPETGSSRH